jgi:hypothetical protein
MRTDASEYLPGGGKNFSSSIVLDSEFLLKSVCNKIFVVKLDKHSIYVYFNRKTQQISSKSFINNRIAFHSFL